MPSPHRLVRLVLPALALCASLSPCAAQDSPLPTFDVSGVTGAGRPSAGFDAGLFGRTASSDSQDTFVDFAGPMSATPETASNLHPHDAEFRMATKAPEASGDLSVMPPENPLDLDVDQLEAVERDPDLARLDAELLARPAPPKEQVPAVFYAGILMTMVIIVGLNMTRNRLRDRGPRMLETVYVARRRRATLHADSRKQSAPIEEHPQQDSPQTDAPLDPAAEHEIRIAG